MFIWDWVSIAFGWLVFLLLIFIILAVISGIIKGCKERIEEMNRDNKPKMDKVKIGGIVYEIEKITDLQGKTGEWGHIEYKTCRIVLDDSASQQIEDQTLIHEITHGILVEAGYINHEEEQADRIGKILYQVLVDNDFSWLKNRK